MDVPEREKHYQASLSLTLLPSDLRCGSGVGVRWPSAFPFPAPLPPNLSALSSLPLPLLPLLHPSPFILSPFLILPLPHFASSSMQAQAEAKREHEGAVQLLEVGSLQAASGSTGVGGKAGKFRESWSGLWEVCVCVGGGVGLQEGPLHAPEPWEPPSTIGLLWARAQLGRGSWVWGQQSPPLPPTPEAAFTLKYPSV